MRKTVVVVLVILIVGGIFGIDAIKTVEASNIEILASTNVAEVVTSFVELEDGRALFVTPEYTPIPDVAYWYIISSDGRSIEAHSTRLPHDSVLIRLYKYNGEILATAITDTSYAPSGPMGVYKYDQESNTWTPIFEYQGNYHRVDTWSLVVYSEGYILSGNLMETKGSNREGFIAAFSKDGSLKWIKTFRYPEYTRITAYIFQHGNDIYSFLRGDGGPEGHSVFLGLIKVDPTTGNYIEVSPGDPAYTPFLIRDRLNNQYDTIGLIEVGGNTIKVYEFENNSWKEYTVLHPINSRISINEGTLYNGQYLIAYWGADQNVYLTNLNGFEEAITPSTNKYTGGFTTGITPNYIFVGYNSGYGTGTAITLNAPDLMMSTKAPTEKLETDNLYKYVFPLVYLESAWGVSAYESSIIVIALEETELWIDGNFNGVLDSTDPVFNLEPGKRFRIGTATGSAAKIPVDYQWKKNPIIIYTNKPVSIFMWRMDAHYGDYDDHIFGYSAPTPSTKLVGANVRWLYITPWKKDAKVYINGEFQGTIKYGETLVKQFDTPTTVVITSDNPVVAVSAYFDAKTRSMTYAFPLMPPSLGEVVIPPSVKSYAEQFKAKSVNEYYLILDENGNIIKNETLPSEPEVLSLSEPSAVFVFRTFYYPDPWGGGAPRYAMSAVSLKPVQESTCYGILAPPTQHGVTREIVIYAKDDVTLYKDYNIDWTIDETEVIPKNQLYTLSPNDVNNKLIIYAKGLMTCSYVGVGGWSGQLENAWELGASPYFGQESVLRIYGHDVSIQEKVVENQTKEFVENETVKVTYQATTEIYKVTVKIDAEEKPGYLVRHNVTIINVEGEVEAFRTIFNISKEVAYSVEDMILPPDAIVINPEPVIALDIKDPKEGESVNQTIIILTEVPENEFMQGVKIQHQVITKSNNPENSTCGPGIFLGLAILPLLLRKRKIR